MIYLKEQKYVYFIQFPGNTFHVTSIILVWSENKFPGEYIFVLGSNYIDRSYQVYTIRRNIIHI